MTTNIQVSDEVWNKLNKLKSFPGESFDEVIKKILKIEGKKDDNKSSK